MLRLRKQEVHGPKFLLDLQSWKALELSQKIKALDGHYIDSKHFEKSATHLITDTIRCTEKFLGACVRGLWVLSPKYIEDSYEVGMWLMEEDYEHSLQQKHHLVAAAKRWRWRIAMHNEQPFTGMHVAVLLSSHSAYYEKLLIYGGAQVLKLSIPLRGDANLSQILYVFTDQSYKDHVQTLQEYGLVCLDYMFIVDTIIKDEQLDILEYMVRKDSDTSHLQCRSMLNYTGLKSTRISYVDHRSETNIQTIKAVDGIYNVDLPVEYPQVKRTLKSKVSKPAPLLIGSSQCANPKTPRSVNSATRGSLSNFANEHAHLKNVTNLSRKENALTESKEVGLDILKANVQKNTLKELNDVVLMQQLHKNNIVESKPALAEKCHVDVSLNTVKVKTQNHTSETTNRCIKVSEEPHTKPEVLSSLSKHHIQQATIKNLESQESSREASNISNSLIHISELKYKLNPSIQLSSNKNALLSSATTHKTLSTGGKLCKQNKHAITKESTESYNQSGFKKKTVKTGNQQPVTNICLSQKTLDFGSKLNIEHNKNNINSHMLSLPPVQVNNQLHDCQSDWQNIPHVMISSSGLPQSENVVQDGIVWETTDVNSEDVSSCVVSQSDMHTGAHVDTDSVTFRMSSKCGSTCGTGRQDSKDKSVSTSDRHSNEDKSVCASGRQDNEDICESTSGRQNNVEKFGSTSGRQDSEDSCVSTSGRHDNEDKSASTSSKQDHKDTCGSTSDRQNEGKHRSLWSDVIYIDDESSEVNTNETDLSASTVSNVTTDRLHLSTSSPVAHNPKSPSTPEVHKFSPLMETPALLQLDQIFSPAKLSPVKLSTLGKNFQARLHSFGFSSVSRKSKDTESKEHLFVSKDAPARVYFSSIRKRKKLAKAISETLMEIHTQRGLAKRRVVDTTLSHTETTDDECPDLSSSTQDEHFSTTAEGCQSNACGNASASSSANGCLRKSNSPVQSELSNTELSHVTTHTQRGLAKRRVGDITLSHTETTDKTRPDLSICIQNKKPSMATKSQSNACGSTSVSTAANSCLRIRNSPKQSELLNPERSHKTTHTQRGLAKRRAMDDCVLLSESKVSRNPSKSASSGDVISPVIRDAETDVCGHNQSIHGNNTKNDCNKMNNPVSWSTELSSQSTHTQRGLAKKKASLAQTQGTNQDNPLWCDSHDENMILATAKGGYSGSDHDSSKNNQDLPMIHPSSQFSSSCDQTTKDSTYAVINQFTVRSIDNDKDLRHLKMEEFAHSSCSMTHARVVADSTNAIKSEKEILPIVKSDNCQNSAQENDGTNRSLFESFSKYFDIKPETSCSGDIHFRSVFKSEPGSSSELTVSADVDRIPPDSKHPQDIKELNVFKKVNSPVKIITSADSLNNDDYIDLPTPPSLTCHDSDTEAVETATAVRSTNKADSDKLPLDCNPSSVTECVPDEIQQHAAFQGKVYSNRHEEGNTSTQSSESYPLWPLTYLLSLNRHDPNNKPFLPVIYGQWMESARDMGFHHQAIAHAKPTKSRLPTSLLLSELVRLAQSTDELDCPLAITYLYTWLELHPPVTPVTVKLYAEAFEFSSESSLLFDIIRDIMGETKQNSAIFLLEYFISVFEINFDSCLRSGKKACLQNCLFIKWLWRNSYTIIDGRTIHHLLKFFEYTMTAPHLNYRASNAACALLSLACECLRLANVQWDQQSPKFIIDSVITLAHNIATKIHSSFKTGDKSKSIILNMLRPAWLKILVSAKLLCFYNDYLLPDPIHVNSISMSSIVSQYFFLVPLRSGEKSGIQDHVDYNHAIGHTSKSLEEGYEATKVKRQKGVLTAEKVNRRNGKGESAIHIACMKNKASDLVKLLAVPGADMNLRDNNGWTPLHEACHHGSIACVELLLKHVPRAPIGASANQEQTSNKVEVDAPGPDGLTPLHDAVCRNNIDVCKLLLSYGGKKLLKSKTVDNMTAIDFAQSDEMRAVLNGSPEASFLLDLSISQDLDDPTGIIDAVKEIAPLTQRYKEVTGTDHSQLTSRGSCEEFLMLLTVLVSSYYSILEPLDKCGQADPKEKDVLEKINIHLKFFKRHLRKLTTPEDFDRLQFRLECFESLCIYKPGKVYL